IIIGGDDRNLSERITQIAEYWQGEERKKGDWHRLVRDMEPVLGRDLEIRHPLTGYCATTKRRLSDSPKINSSSSGNRFRGAVTVSLHRVTAGTKLAPLNEIGAFPSMTPPSTSCVSQTAAGGTKSG